MQDTSNIVSLTQPSFSGKLHPRKRTKEEITRNWLTEDEVEALRGAARKTGRHSHRDSTIILMAFTHGMRVSELVSLKWDQVDLKAGRLFVRRKKKGTASTQLLRGQEIRALRKLRRDYPNSPFVFASERGGPLTTSTVRKMVGRAGEQAGIGFLVAPHMLRHACGYKLANDGQDTRAIQHYLGHKNIQHTVAYTELSPERFRDFWPD